MRKQISDFNAKHADPIKVCLSISLAPYLMVPIPVDFYLWWPQREPTRTGNFHETLYLQSGDGVSDHRETAIHS